MKWFRRNPVAKYKIEKTGTQLRIMRAHIAAQASEIGNVRHAVCDLATNFHEYDARRMREHRDELEWRERVERALAELRQPTSRLRPQWPARQEDGQ